MALELNNSETLFRNSDIHDYEYYQCSGFGEYIYQFIVPMDFPSTMTYYCILNHFRKLLQVNLRIRISYKFKYSKITIQMVRYCSLRYCPDAMSYTQLVHPTIASVHRLACIHACFTHEFTSIYSRLA